MTALVVAIGSLLVWAVANATAARKIVWPRERLQVVAVNSYDGGIILNDGDRDAFVSHVFLSMTDRALWVAQRFPVRDQVRAGGFLRIAPPSQSREHDGPWVRGLESAAFETLVTRAVNKDACFAIVLFAKTDALFLELSAIAGPTLNTIAADGYVVYRVAGSQEFHQAPVAAIGAVQVTGGPTCQLLPAK